jgi:hypothetical protein
MHIPTSDLSRNTGHAKDHETPTVIIRRIMARYGVSASLARTIAWLAGLGGVA